VEKKSNEDSREALRREISFHQEEVALKPPTWPPRWEEHPRGPYLPRTISFQRP
jgi:hypothetical protein